jgi:LysM repeat protein
MATSGQTQLAHQIFREGFEVSCWTFGGFAVVRAHPIRARDGSADSLPALPSRARIVVWGNGGGQIRDRLREPTLRARIVAWFRRVPFPSREAQLEALTDELLAAISQAPDSDGWTERGGEAPVPRRPFPLPGQLPLDGELPGRQHSMLGFGMVAVGALLLLLAATMLWRSTDSSDASDVPIAPVQINEPQDETDLGRGATDGGAQASDEPDAAPESTRDGNLRPTALEGGAADDGAVDPSDLEAVFEAGPARPVDPLESYVVQAGDTLGLIAQRLEVGLDDFVATNELDPGASIHPGQVLRIP